VPVGGDIDDPRPDGDLLDLVRLGHARSPLCCFEAVAPDRCFAPAFLGCERELAAGLGDEDAAAARPAHETERAAPVVADEARVRRRSGRAVGPLDAVALRA